MKIIAITKTFRGSEFALDSLASVYPHIDKMVYIHSEVGWNGDKGNTVRDIVKKAPDPLKKLIHLSMEGTQAEQYNYATDYLLKQGIEFDYIMLIDTDEVWDQAGWDTATPRLLENIKNGNPIKSFKVRVHDYIKSPFYRVDPPSPAKPTAFLHRSGLVNGIGLRGLGIAPHVLLKTTYYHHFCSVRNSLGAVLNKHDTSCTAEAEPMVDATTWIRNVWNRLPNATNCLPLVKHASNWKGVKEISISELPQAVRNNPLVLAWAQYPTVSFPHTTVAISPSGPPLKDPRIRTRWGM